MFTERNFLIGLFIVIVVMNIWIATVPYDPIDGDKADATTNVVWQDYYREGKWVVPFDEWQADNNPPTQSGVIEIDGEPYVVNEKGPAHAIFTMVLGPLTGTVFLVIGVVSTYMLGRRVFNWRVGAIASLLVLTNLTVIIMWHRFFWVDTSTTHLMVLGIWLFVESGISMKDYIYKGEKGMSKNLAKALLLGFAGGVAFGASVSTRYTVGIVVIAVVIYPLALYFALIRKYLKERDMKQAFKNVLRACVLLLPFILGLMLVLIPLMNYNNTYFGGPFNSGYDPMAIRDYERSQGDITARNQTSWVTTNPMQKVENLFENTFLLTPILIFRMPGLIFVPLAVWKLRRRPILYLLLPWLILVLFAFLVMDWVGGYSNAYTLVQEPRYHLPSLPPVALLAGYALDQFSKKSNPGRRSAAFVVTVVIMLALPGVLMAEAHFKDVREGKLGQKPPQDKNQVTVVVIGDLYHRADRLDGGPVDIRTAIVEFIDYEPQGEIRAFDISDSSDTRNVTVRPSDFPPGTLPTLEVGDQVSVKGILKWVDRDQNKKVDEGEILVNVKYGTPDEIRKK